MPGFQQNILLERRKSEPVSGWQIGAGREHANWKFQEQLHQGAGNWSIGTPLLPGYLQWTTRNVSLPGLLGVSL